MDKAKLKSAIGANVRQLREKCRFTQERLAEAVDRSPEAISLLERGRSMPSLVTLGALAEALGVPMADLLSPAGLPRTTRREDAERRLSAAIAGMDDQALEAAAAMVELLRGAVTRRR